MNIGFQDILTHHANFLAYVCEENIDALRGWKNLGPVSPQKVYRDAFHIAVRDNLLESMTYLLEHPHFYTPQIYNNAIVTVCVFTHSQEMFNMLYPLSNPKDVERSLIEDGGHEHWTLLQQRMEQMESERLQHTISNAVGNDKVRCARVLKI